MKIGVIGAGTIGTNAGTENRKNCQNGYFLDVKNKELIKKLVDTIYKANQTIVGKMAEADNTV